MESERENVPRVGDVVERTHVASFTDRSLVISRGDLGFVLDVVVLERRILVSFMDVRGGTTGLRSYWWDDMKSVWSFWHCWSEL